MKAEKDLSYAGAQLARFCRCYMQAKVDMPIRPSEMGEESSNQAVRRCYCPTLQLSLKSCPRSQRKLYATYKLEPSLKSPPNIVMLYYTIMSVFIQGDYVNNWFQNDLEKSFPSC